MTAPAPLRWWDHPVEQAKPPMDAGELKDILRKIRGWQPFDGGVVLDDVAVVLDEVMPGEEHVEELAQRLRGHLMRLVEIAVAASAGQEDDQAAELIALARTVRSEDLPGDHWRAVGHLRRMGWIVNELLDRLVVTKCLKEAA